MEEGATEKQVKELEEMYGAEFDCGLNKTADNHILKFYILIFIWKTQLSKSKLT